MKAFIVSVNGRRLCTAGIGPNGVLHAIVGWVGGGSNRSAVGRLDFHLGGLDCRTDEHVDWSTPELTVGDKVEIHVVEADVVDPEACRRTVDRSGGG